VEQRRYRGDAAGKHAVDQPVVEVKTGRVDGPSAGGLDARPGEREPVGVDAELGHQANVLGPAVIVIVGDVAGVAVADRPIPPAEGVPHGLAAAVFGDGAFDLIGGGGDAPGEAGRK